MFRCQGCGAINRVGERRAGADGGQERPVCGRCKAALDTSGAPQPVTGDQLRRLVEASPVPVLVDFWAPWCPPCRAAAPIFDQVGRARAGQLLVVKLDTEEHPDVGQAYAVRGIPTFVLLSQGREVARQSGLMPRPQLEAWIDASLGSHGAAASGRP